MDPHQQDRQRHGLAGQLVDAHQRTQEQQDQPVGDTHCNVRPQQQLPGKVDRLLIVPGTDAAPHHRDHGKTDRLPGDAAHAVQIVCHSVGGDLHRTKGGDHAYHKDAPRLKQTIFKGGGNADAKNAPCHCPLQPKGLGHGQHLSLPVAPAQNQHRRHHTGDDAGPRHAVHPHLQPKDAHCVAHHIDDVHQHADLHGDLGVAHAAEQRRPSIVQRKEGVADGYDLQVQHACVQNICLNGAVEQPDHGACQYKADHRHRQTQQPTEKDQLPGTVVRTFPLLCTQILAHHHGTAGGKGGKQYDDQVVDHVHKTDTGDRRLSAAGHHHGIRHTHRHCQQLLHQQWSHQPQQFFLGEQRLPPAEQRRFFSFDCLIRHILILSCLSGLSRRFDALFRSTEHMYSS